MRYLNIRGKILNRCFTYKSPRASNQIQWISDYQPTAGCQLPRLPTVKMGFAGESSSDVVPADCSDSRFLVFSWKHLILRWMVEEGAACLKWLISWKMFPFSPPAAVDIRKPGRRGWNRRRRQLEHISLLSHPHSPPPPPLYSSSSCSSLRTHKWPVHSLVPPSPSPASRPPFCITSSMNSSRPSQAAV